MCIKGKARKQEVESTCIIKLYYFFLFVSGKKKIKNEIHICTVRETLCAKQFQPVVYMQQTQETCKPIEIPKLLVLTLDIPYIVIRN